MNHKIKFYPVDNGDTTLITLNDNTSILIDCKIRTSAEDPDDTSKYDVKKDLIESIQKRNDKPYLDLFILTHPDKDHCHGFDKHFYKGNPQDYKKVNLENEEIIIDELWITSMLFNGAENDDAKSLKKEAERRRKLWTDDDSNKNKPGNKIRMIGYDGDKKFEKTPASIPGELINEINGSPKSMFEIFIHSPFKQTLITATSEKDKNYSSIVFQARFKTNESDKDFKYFVLLGGDADHYNWKEIYEKSKLHGNLDKLKWDILLAPHHCSWTYFNDVPYGTTEETKTPKETSIKVLEQKAANGKIVASCKTIKNNDDNPPHYKAKDQYLKYLDNKEQFYNTAILPSEDAPEPLVFEISHTGIEKQLSDKEKDDKRKLDAAFRVASTAVIQKPWCKK
jgi:beta-lactamase superfamily II metal-dependent hydrolase